MKKSQGFFCMFGSGSFGSSDYLACSDPVQHVHVTRSPVQPALIQRTDERVGKHLVCFSSFTYNKTKHGLITCTIFDWEGFFCFGFFLGGGYSLDEVKIMWLTRSMKNLAYVWFGSSVCRREAVNWYNLTFWVVAVHFLWFPPPQLKDVQIRWTKFAPTRTRKEADCTVNSCDYYYINNTGTFRMIWSALCCLVGDISK